MPAAHLEPQPVRAFEILGIDDGAGDLAPLERHHVVVCSPEGQIAQACGRLRSAADVYLDIGEINPPDHPGYVRQLMVDEPERVVMRIDVADFFDKTRGGRLQERNQLINHRRIDDTDPVRPYACGVDDVLVEPRRKYGRIINRRKVDVGRRFR